MIQPMNVRKNKMVDFTLNPEREGCEGNKTGEGRDIRG